MIAELRTSEGGFASALDADSDGRGGRVLRLDARPSSRGARRARTAAYAAELFGVTQAGTFEHGRSVLQLPRRPGRSGAATTGSASALLAARAAPVRPGRDDKVVAAWNGLAIAALAEAGLLLGRPDFVAAAGAAADAARRRAPERRPAGPDARRRGRRRRARASSRTTPASPTGCSPCPG